MTPECGRCGSRAIAHVNGVGRQCLMCGHVDAAVEGLPVMAFVLVTVTDAARRCGVSVRTVRRWIDAGVVVGGSSRVQGRPRLVNVASVEAHITTRARARTCEWCGGEIPPAGVQRSSKVSRRWCAYPAPCKKRAFRAAVGRLRTASPTTDMPVLPMVTPVPVVTPVVTDVPMVTPVVTDVPVLPVVTDVPMVTPVPVNWGTRERPHSSRCQRCGSRAVAQVSGDPPRCLACGAEAT